MDETDSGIFCPSCKMKNDMGAIICTHCNTSLNKNSQETDTSKKVPDGTSLLPDYYDDTLGAPVAAPTPTSPSGLWDFEIPTNGIIFINLDNNQPVTMQTEKAFILGHVSTEVKFPAPLVNLTDIDLFSLGISRAHAMIRQTEDGYEIIDLESTNGTWHENQKLVPKKPYPIESGDRIRIGRLHMLAFYIRKT